MQTVALFVISLAERNPRRAEIAARLEALGLRATFFDAVDGRAGLGPWEAELDRAKSRRRLGRELGHAEYACSLSHRGVYRAFLETGKDWAVVLEDDAILGEAFVRFMTEGAYARAPMTLLHHYNARALGAATEIMPGHQGHRLAASPFMAVGYALNRAAAAALNDAQTPLYGIPDWPMDLWELGAVAAVPEIVGHPPRDVNSDLAATRSDARPPLGRVVSLAYIRRKWRKLRARRIS